MVKRCRTCGSEITRKPHNPTDLLWYCGHSCAASDTNRWRRYTPGTKTLRCTVTGCGRTFLAHSHSNPATARCALHRADRLRERKAATARRRKLTAAPRSD